MKLIRFLLVEDNQDHADLIRETFASQRFSNPFDHVASGEDALAYLRKTGEFADVPTPDVVLLDLNLPGLDGLDVLREAKTDPALRSIPIVILTTSAAERDRVGAYEFRANSYIIKPVGLDQLQQVVEQLDLYLGVLSKPPT